MAKTNLRDPEQWVPREVFAAYCGAKSEKLLAYYDKAKARRSFVTMHFDWLAFFALPAWLGYRQQWTLWATLVGMLAAISVFESFAHMTIPPSAFAGTMIAMGLMAHGFLLTDANARYLKLKDQGLSTEAISAQLAGRASAKPAHAVAGLLASLVVLGALGWFLPV